MKKTITCLILTAGLFALSPVDARKWTSADGKKTFSGDFKSYNETSGKVTVTKGFRDVSFNIEMLAEADREWLKEQTKAGKAEREAKMKAEESTRKLDAQKIGSKIKQGVLSKLKDGEFVDFTMTGAPDYYVVYYSGSW